MQSKILTESEFQGIVNTTFALGYDIDPRLDTDWMVRDFVCQKFGYVIVPDDGATNAEQLASLLREAENHFNGAISADHDEFAEWLDERGVKAGTNDDWTSYRR